MYSKKAWGGAVDPFILTTFVKSQDVKDDPLVSVVVFEWKDEDLIGVWPSPEAAEVGEALQFTMGGQLMFHLNLEEVHL